MSLLSPILQSLFSAAITNSAAPMPGQQSNVLQSNANLPNFSEQNAGATNQIGNLQQQQQNPQIFTDNTDVLPPLDTIPEIQIPGDMGSGGGGNYPSPQFGGMANPAVGMPSQPAQEKQMSSQAPPAWGNLLAPVGNLKNPNAFVKAGVGYDQGGLMGALGYLLTDMSQQGNPKQ